MKKLLTGCMVGMALLAGGLQAKALSVVSVTPNPAETSADNLGTVTTYTITLDGAAPSGVSIMGLKFTGGTNSSTNTYSDYDVSPTVTVNGSTITVSVENTSSEWNNFINAGIESSATQLELILQGLSGLTTSVPGTKMDIYNWGWLYVDYDFGEVSGGSGSDEMPQLTVSPGVEADVTLKKNQVGEVTFSAAGELVLLVEGSWNYNSEMGINCIIFKSQDFNYDNAIKPEKSVDLWASYPEDGVDIDTRKYEFAEGAFEPNKPYYIYFVSSSTNVNEAKFIFNLTGEDQIIEDVALVRGSAIEVLKGQHGTIAVPDEATNLGNAASIQIAITVNSTDDLGNAASLLVPTQGTVNFVSQTENDGNTTYLYTSYKAYGPWYFVQNAVETLQVTLTFPDYDAEKTEVFVGTPFTATADEVVQFTPEAGFITITAPTAYSEQQWNRMLSTTADMQTTVSASTENNFADSSAGATDNRTECIFRVNASTYYFKAPADGTYSIDYYTGASFEFKDEPFSTEGVLVFPAEGADAAYLYTVQFMGENLNEEYSPLTGAKITNPDGKALKINKVYIESQDNSSTQDCVSFMIEMNSDAEAWGPYTIYIPANFVYNNDGYPNDEVNLTYTFSPTGEVTATPFAIDEVTTNIPDVEEGLISSFGVLNITFPFDVDYVSGITEVNLTINGENSYGELENNVLSVPVQLAATTENLNVRVQIPIGQIENEAGEVNPSMAFSFNLYAPNQVATFGPESGTTFEVGAEDMTVTVTWPGFVSFNNSDDDPLATAGITLSSETGNIGLTFFENFDYSDDQQGFVFDLSGLEAGTYTITIPAGVLQVVEMPEDFSAEVTVLGLNAAATATFTIAEDEEEDPGIDEPGTDEPGEGGGTDGIAGIEADANGLFNVYTLQGNKVMTTTELNSLAKGIYIINGKKVLVK